jgi:hypothetical protein
MALEVNMIKRTTCTACTSRNKGPARNETRQKARLAMKKEEGKREDGSYGTRPRDEEAVG